MGTNYYFMTRNKELAHKHFAVETDWGVTDMEYEIVDSKFLGYKIHLNKLSCGWRPLFQRHKAFKTWKELEEFYKAHSERCKPEEAELWIPLDHVKYFETEKAAKKKFGAYSHYIFDDFKHWNDPDYPIDWTEGDFS